MLTLACTSHQWLPSRVLILVSPKTLLAVRLWYILYPVYFSSPLPLSPGVHVSATSFSGAFCYLLVSWGDSSVAELSCTQRLPLAWFSIVRSLRNMSVHWRSRLHFQCSGSLLACVDKSLQYRLVVSLINQLCNLNKINGVSNNENEHLSIILITFISLSLMKFNGVHCSHLSHYYNRDQDTGITNFFKIWVYAYTILLFSNRSTHGNFCLCSKYMRSCIQTNFIYKIFHFHLTPCFHVDPYM